MPDIAPIANLERAFLSFQNYKFKEYGFPFSPEDFRKSLKELDGNFIKIDKWGQSHIIAFHNPSIKDFIEDFLTRNDLELLSLCSSAEFFEQCETLYKYIKYLDVDRYIDELQKNLFTSECSGLSNYEVRKTIHGDMTNFRIESRILFLLKVYKDYKENRILNSINRLIEILIESLNSNMGNKEEILRVAATLSTMKLNFNEKQFYESIKMYFTNNLDNLEDFNYIVLLSKINPELFINDDLDELRAQFNDYYYYFVRDLELSSILDRKSVVEPDPELIRESGKILEDIGGFLDIDIENGIKRLEYAATEIENKSEDSEDDTDWNFKGLRQDNEQIESLFEMLKEPLD